MGGGWLRGAVATEEFSRKFPEKEGVERNFVELRAKKRFRENFWGDHGHPGGHPQAALAVEKSGMFLPCLPRGISYIPSMKS